MYVHELFGVATFIYLSEVVRNLCMVVGNLKPSKCLVYKCIIRKPQLTSMMKRASDVIILTVYRIW